MPRSSRWIVVALSLLAALALSACGKPATGGEAEGEETHAKVEDIAGSDLKRVLLTPSAERALGIQTAVVRATREEDGGRALEVPYAAVFYDADGRAFTYTNPSTRTYVRQRISVDDIHDNRAFLTKGPRPGTTVVTVGAEELLGVEEGVQE